jgi:formylglycine-generating enzyme required for sulfatase activity
MPMATQMNSKPSPAASMFEKVLRAFETRGITYSDVLARLRRLLATGASPKELLVVLRRRESAERMPEYARIEALLVEALERAARNESQDLAPDRSPDRNPDPVPADSDVSAPPTPSTVVSMPAHPPGPHEIEPVPHEDEVVVDLDFNAPGKELEARRGLRASELDLSALARHLRSIEQRTPGRGANLEALTRSYERAKEGESAAAERAAALAADLQAAHTSLQAAHTSLQAEQGKLREIEQTVAERDTALEQSRQALAEREARIASLSRDRTALQAALEARARAAAGLEADLRAARARAEAVKPEVKSSREPEREAAAVLAPATPAPTTPAPTISTPTIPPASNPSAANPSPQRRSSGWLGGPARAIGWSAAAALLAGFFWLFVHRSSPPPAPAPSAAVPIAGTAIRDCPTCPEMTVLPAGRFKQGSVGAPGYEQPLHWVVIGHPIAMSTAPVTVDDFGQFVTATGRDMQGCDTYDGEWKHRPADSWEQPGFAQTGTHPVTCVSWNDAEAYATWLSSKTGHRYRLPSASEWEYAARAGAVTPQLWGSGGEDACANANVADASAGRRYPGWAVFPCDDGYVYTAPVGAFKANVFGLNDMLGNVLQWTEDCWHDNYAGAPIDGSAWTDGNCSLHEIRGGSWFSNPSYVRADYRNRFPADYRTSSAGIRLVRDIGP